MIEVTPEIKLDESRLAFDFMRSPGPGGQKVNKVCTAVQLRFDPSGLPAEVRDRLLILAGRRASKEGLVIIKANRYRTQSHNRRDALQRLIELIRAASRKPRRRRPTRPPAASRERRLEVKRRRSQVKSLRRTVTY